MKKPRINFEVEKEMKLRVQAECERTGLTISDVMRRAIDKYLKQ